MKKKLVSALLIVSVVVSQVQALTLRDMILQNGTSPGTYNVGGEKIFYGGNYEMRFKNSTTTFKPWINGQPPKFSIGCNGLSISGGFISMLGLDDIKQQLSDASAAFAWGIMVGLVYSMPGIKDVFETLQKWARTIQKLLQNSCKIGTDLVKNTPAADAIHDVFESVSSASFGEAKNFLDSFDDKLNAFNNFVNDAISNKKESSLAANLSGYKINSLKANMFTLFFGKYIPVPSNIDEKAAHVDTLYDFFTNKKIADLSLNIDNADTFDRKVLLYKLMLLLYGDLVAPSANIDLITEVLNSDGTLNKDAAVAKMAKAVNGGKDIVDNKSLGLIYAKPALDASVAITGLIKGFNSDDVIEAAKGICDSNGCLIPNRYIFYYAAKKKIPNSSTTGTTDSNLTNIIKGAVITQATGSGDIYFQWDGFYNESLNAIRYAVAKNSGVKSYVYYGSAPTAVTSNIFFYPAISRYVNILSKLALEQKGENAYIYSLEQSLAKVNSYIGASLLIAYSKTYIKTLQSSPNQILTITNTQQLKDFEKRVDTINSKLKEELNNYLQYDDVLKGLSDTFDKIEKDIKIQQSQKYGF